MLTTLTHQQLDLRALRKASKDTVAVCVPARNVADTITSITKQLVDLRAQGLLDRVIVLDGESTDDTANVAERAGAEVVNQANLMPDFGPVIGKGDALWRVLSVVGEDIICFVDGDSNDFGEHYVTGLVGTLLAEQEVQYVKAYYQRPFQAAGTLLPSGGGRVTELMARPLLNAFYPELAHFRQPLAGEFAGRTELLKSLPFTTGYGIEIGLLIDVYQRVGIQAMAQVDLKTRQNEHQELADLGPMAYAVLKTVLRRLERQGSFKGAIPDHFLRLGGQGKLEDLSLPERPALTDVLAKVR